MTEEQSDTTAYRDLLVCAGMRDEGERILSPIGEPSVERCMIRGWVLLKNDATSLLGPQIHRLVLTSKGEEVLAKGENQ